MAAAAFQQISSGAGQGVTMTANAPTAAGKCLKVVTTDGRVSVTATDTDVLMGASINSCAAAGDPLQVAVPGDVVLMTAGAATTLGARLMATTSGKVIDATANKQTVGIGLSAAAADGDAIPVLIFPAPIGTV